MNIDFPGGTRVDAHFHGLTVPTDQPPQSGGEGSAPSPYETFLAALGTCAGYYVLGFCRQRGISTDGIRVRQRVRINPATKLAESVELELQLPEDFPENYREAVIRAAELCKVKKQFEHPPQIEVTTSLSSPASR
jgi:ribosomal protein S12 methylthiotransferase accessory factor